MTLPYGPFRLGLALVYGAIWLALAIAPSDRGDWALENGLVAVAAVVLVVSARALPLSRVSYSLIFVFLCLHAVGAHYTYAEVPYNAWTEALFGRPLNDVMGWQRNHFDRLVHFLYGLLLAYPVRELFLRIANVRGFWGYFLPLDLTMSTSMLFELIEWAAAIIVGGDLADVYLGQQGDIWDAHKDMALASAGALVAMTITMLINWRLNRDFAREWAESLRVKSRVPLGERTILRWLRQRRLGNG
jgi:putative membrane protein